jgi:hypothetical protein
VFRTIQEGNLEALQGIERTMPRDQFLAIKNYGGYTMLAFAF